MKKTLIMSFLMNALLLSAQPVIHLVGDSTMCFYRPNEAGLTGWGQALAAHCRPEIKIDNRAIAGYSTKCFLEDGYWEKLLAQLKAGDFVVIQFGHNDQKKHVPSKYAPAETTYRELLKRFIDDVRAKGAFPVLATSIPRRNFGKGGRIESTLELYPEMMLRVAAENQVPAVDMHQLGTAALETMGEKKSAPLFLLDRITKNPKQLDNTHLTPEGADFFAALFVDEAKSQQLPIAGCFR